MIRVLLLAVISTACAVAFAQHAHEHGAARLDVALDGPRLQVVLHSPLDNLVGFEHAPRDDRQRAALRRMAEDLAAADRLFKLPAAAGCKPVGSRVSHPFQSAGTAAPAAQPPVGKSTSPKRGQDDAHADLEATWDFECATPAALDRLDVMLYDAFRGLKRIRVQVAGAKRQGAVTLSPSRRTVAF